MLSIFTLVVGEKAFQLQFHDFSLLTFLLFPPFVLFSKIHNSRVVDLFYTLLGCFNLFPFFSFSLSLDVMSVLYTRFLIHEIFYDSMPIFLRFGIHGGGDEFLQLENTCFWF